MPAFPASLPSSPPARPPSVDALARSLADDHGIVELPAPLRVDAARAGIAEAVAAGDPASARRRAILHAAAMQRAMLGPVINATGVLLHTNLGRAPISAWRDGGSGLAPTRFVNVEFDLATGKRGSRRDHASSLLARLCGAEAALVVNNCAAAVTLVLAALARGRSVAVSRGELVEIGGGFRVPEVLEQSGAKLVEVGTTNRTRLRDYEQAVARSGGDVALLLKVHQSNYRITGFTEETDVWELAAFGAAETPPIPVVADIGSGLLDSSTPWLADSTGRMPTLPWLVGEPAARQTLSAGAGLVTFSGDKLFGGPQAGVIAGRRDLVERCAAHPLARAVRPGALVLEAMQSTCLAYLRSDASSTIPFWRMATLSCESLRVRAERIAAAVSQQVAVKVVETDAVPGGGTLPGVTIASVGVAVDGDATARLRSADPPIVARVVDGVTVCDLRTVDPADDGLLVAALRGCSAPATGS